MTISVRTLWRSAMFGLGTAIVVLLVRKLMGLHVNEIVFVIALGLFAGAGAVLIQTPAKKPGTRDRRG